MAADEDAARRTLAVDALGWKSEEARFPLSGRLLFAQPEEHQRKEEWEDKLVAASAALAILSEKPVPEASVGALIAEGKTAVVAPQDPSSIKDASLLLFEDQVEASLARDPLSLERCIVSCEPEWEGYFEIQESETKEYFVFKGEDAAQTKLWLATLQFYTQNLGSWRKRRKGLANIEVDPNLLSPEGAAGGGEADD